ncbi:hypothetical protein GLA29479_4652 [Lysobacter antibioticus]|nr:hypothetical protein GLA29479_4652 [Lysobacter antibioticus]
MANELGRILLSVAIETDCETIGKPEVEHGRSNIVGSVSMRNAQADSISEVSHLLQAASRTWPDKMRQVENG